MAVPVLTDANQNPISNTQALSINAQGLALLLQLEKGQELTADTVLNIKPVANTEVLTVNISSDQGAFVTGKSVSWLLVDWGIERPLSKVKVVLKTANADCKLRLKVFSYGHWIPLMPIDIFATGSEQRFASVLTSKVMLELGTVGDYGLWKATSVEVNSVEVKADVSPSDVSVSLAEQKLDFKAIGVLPALGKAVTNFFQAVNDYRQKNPDDLNIPLNISANSAGSITIEFKPVAHTVIQQLPNNANNQLKLTWTNTANQAAAQTSIALPNNAKLQSISLDLTFEPVTESVQGDAQSIPTQHAQFINERSQIAQCCYSKADSIILTGVALQLKQRSDSLDVSLAIHPNQHGYPAAQPYQGAILTLDNAEWQNDWLFLTFKTPIQLTDAVWWLVLTVTGEAFWQFRQQTAAENIALYRIDGGNWLACETGLELQTKIRLFDNTEKKLTQCVLTRGSISQTLSITENKITVTPDSLSVLNSVSNQALQLQFIAEATGTLTLNHLRIAYS